VSIQIVPLLPEHLEAAASLVAGRYRAARVQIPFLPATFEDGAGILPRLEEHLGGVPGVAARCDNGRLAGFIMSFLVSNRGERMAYVPDFGHATEPGREYELYRRMYASLADRWLANGCFLHGITLYPNERAASDAWFSAGFGLAVMDALRVVDPDSRPMSAPKMGIDVRRAHPDDIDCVAQLELGLDRHLAASPTFLPLVVGGGRSELESWLGNPKHALWIASQGDEVVGYLRFEPSERMVLPTCSETTVSITGAYTREAWRGMGIGTALLQAGLEWAHSSGYTHCSVDFESANLPGSGFWLRHFDPVTHSLVRRVDPRLAWASARRDPEDVRRAFEGSTWIG
jgi:GNAT superfamily N-acetyltransferase